MENLTIGIWVSYGEGKIDTDTNIVIKYIDNNNSTNNSNIL